MWEGAQFNIFTLLHNVQKQLKISYGIIFHIFYKGSVTTSSFDLQLKYSILFVQNKIKKLRKLEIEKNQPRKINTYILQSSMTWIIMKLSKNLLSLENLKILQVLHIQFTIIKDLKRHVSFDPNCRFESLDRWYLFPPF